MQALFAGKGVQVSAVVLNTPLVTDADVAQWYTSDMTTSSTGNAGGPSSLNVLPTAELSAVRARPVRTHAPHTAAPTATLLRIEEVTKAFGPTIALRGCSLELRAG